MKSFLHIANDEKFIKSAYAQFEEVFPERNLWVIICTSQKELKYVTVEKHMVFVDQNPKAIRNYARGISKDLVVCVHGLDYFRSILVNSLSRKQKIIWFLWGMEFYNNPLIFKKKELLGSRTVENFEKQSAFSNFNKTAKNALRPMRYRILKKSSVPHVEILKAMIKAPYLAILYSEEVDIARKKLNTNHKFLKFSYYPIEKMVVDPTAFVNGKNILLGNSASASNNHLEAFDILQDLNLDGRKVIVPLSYGNMRYKEKIKETGLKVLGAHFEPLDKFMPLYEYNEYLRSCSIVVMNHYRQQSVGNVMTMLWMGAKVYLDERNTLYSYLKRIGVTVYSVSRHLNKENGSPFKKLDKKQQLSNRKILTQEISQPVLQKHLESEIGRLL